MNELKPDQSFLSKFWTKNKWHFGVWGIFTLFAIIQTWPLLPNIHRSIAGCWDNYHVLWIIWWWKYSLIDLKTTPWFSNLLFYPNGFSLTEGHALPLYGILGIPLQMLFKGPITFNILILFNYIFAGASMTYLAKELFKYKSIAILAGFLFAFSPYMTAISANGNIHVTGIGWLALTYLFWNRYLKEGKYSAAIWGGICFSFTALAGAYLVIYLSWFLLLSALIEKVEYKPSWGWFRQRLYLLVRPKTWLFVAFAALGVFYVYSLYSGTSFKGFEHDEPTQYSLDLFHLFIPSHLNPFVGDWIIEQYKNLRSHDLHVSIGTPGIVVWVFGITGLFLMRNRRALFLFIAIIYFTILCLGPVIHIGGNESGENWLYQFYMGIFSPYDQMRIPARHSVMINFALVLAFAGGLKHMKENSKIKEWQICFPIIFLLAFLELVSCPFPTSVGKISPFFKEIAKEKPTGAILTLPYHFFGLNTISYPQYAQIYHHWPLSFGFISHVPENEFARTGRLVDDLFKHPKKAAESILRNNVTYIVSYTWFNHLEKPTWPRAWWDKQPHRLELPEPMVRGHNNMLRRLEEYGVVTLVYADAHLKAYKSNAEKFMMNNYGYIPFKAESPDIPLEITSNPDSISEE